MGSPPRPPPTGLTCASVGLRGHLTGPRAQDAFTGTDDGPEGLAGLPTLPMPPRRRRRRDSEGSRPSLRTVTAPSAPKSRYKTNTFCPLTPQTPSRGHGRKRLPPTFDESVTNKKPDQQIRLAGGRYWDRTSDLFRVKEARYPCANRPRWVRDSNPCIRLCRPLPRLSANPPHPMGSSGFPIESG